MKFLQTPIATQLGSYYINQTKTPVREFLLCIKSFQIALDARSGRKIL